MSSRGSNFGANIPFRWVSFQCKSTEQHKRLKKENAGKEAIEAQNAEIQEKTKAGRDQEAKADDIDAAVFDLKAVNPNPVAKVDTRTPQEIISNIEAQGRTVSEALERLNGLLATADE